MIITREEFVKWLRTWATSFDLREGSEYANKSTTINVTLDLPEIIKLP